MTGQAPVAVMARRRGAIGRTRRPTELGWPHAEMVRGRIPLAAEVRLRMDGLGLTRKGKRVLRWRVVDPPSSDLDEGGGPVASIEDYRRLVGFDSIDKSLAKDN